MLDRHAELVQSDNMRVRTHVQREQGEWILNTLTLEGHEVPFRYKRKRRYRSLEGARVNLTYYPATTSVAGIVMERELAPDEVAADNHQAIPGKELKVRTSSNCLLVRA